MEIEDWVEIPGMEGLYWASSLGNIKSRYRQLQGSPDKDGYLYSTFCIGQQKFCFKFHTLVALAFHGPRPPGKDGEEIRHLDGNNRNSAPDNLKYGSRSENQQDKIRHGRNWALNKKVCPWNHKLEAPNLCSGEWRKCLACSRANGMISYQRNTGKVVSDKQTLSDHYYADIMSEGRCPCPQPTGQAEKVKLHT